MSRLTLPFTHRIPATLVLREIDDIEQRLGSTGYDPTGLDFEDAARQKLVRDVVATAIEAGVHVVQTGWQPRLNGSTEVVFEVEQDADLVALKLALH